MVKLQNRVLREEEAFDTAAAATGSKGRTTIVIWNNQRSKRRWTRTEVFFDDIFTPSDNE